MSQKFETLALHAGHIPDQENLSRAVPIHRTSSFLFKNTEHAANLFALKELGNIYIRLMNPTQDVLEQRVAALEREAAALALASGTSAIHYTIINICQQGDNIVSANNLYGGSYTMFDAILPQFGITTKFVSPDAASNFEAAIDENTKALYVETIGNPVLDFTDIKAISEVAKRHQIPLIEDDPSHATASKYLSKGFGGVVVFGIKGGSTAGEKFINSIELLSHLANVGDAKSLAIHPASTTHSQMEEADQMASGLKPELVRLSIGIENIDDILADIDQALAKA